MASRVLQGDVFSVLPTLTPGSIDCAVTSPPYWQLRSYLAKDHPLKHLELGSEKTPGEFVANMVRVFGLVRTALADHGTCWVNIGDSYSHDSRGGETGGKHMDWHHDKAMSPGRMHKLEGPESGNLCLIPQRLAIALQDDGWFVRSIVIWHKPAPMPTSVSGWRWMRCRKKVKGNTNKDNGKNAESPNRTAVGFNERWREGANPERPQQNHVSRDQYTRILDDPDEQYAVAHDHETFCDAANLRDVWTIASEPLKEKHYAAYPTALVEKCLRAGTSAKGYCPECGAPWVRVVDEECYFASGSGKSGNPAVGKNGAKLQGGGATGDIRNGPMLSTKTIGWRPSCHHADFEPRPGLVLDPFGGSGRTAITAQRLGLDSVSVELNPEYATMMARLIREDSPLFSGLDAA